MPQFWLFSNLFKTWRLSNIHMKTIKIFYLSTKYKNCDVKTIKCFFKKQYRLTYRYWRLLSMTANTQAWTFSPILNLFYRRKQVLCTSTMFFDNYLILLLSSPSLFHQTTQLFLSSCYNMIFHFHFLLFLFILTSAAAFGSDWIGCLPISGSCGDISALPSPMRTDYGPIIFFLCLFIGLCSCEIMCSVIFNFWDFWLHWAEQTWLICVACSCLLIVCRLKKDKLNICKKCCWGIQSINRNSLDAGFLNSSKKLLNPRHLKYSEK